ncbi:MAG: hypothetical protein ACYC8W_01870 [Candidatus Tyrphobacter sp.]
MDIDDALDELLELGLVEVVEVHGERKFRLGDMNVLRDVIFDRDEEIDGGEGSLPPSPTVS